MPKVSVVIPCYNQGHYLNEAVDSVLDQTYKDFEIIIINDGSTDEHTNTLLSNYDRPKTKIIHTNNQGLPSARNKGIKEAQGLYILPLDADDKIGPNYLKEAVYILDGNPNIGIVYCEAEYFGEKTGKWNLEEYRKEVMLINNLIFCSAFFRKSIWKEIGGYNPEMIKGLEDWGYWLKIISLGFEVFKLPEIHFYYRVKKESMVKSLGQSHDNMYEMFILALLDNVALYKNYKMHLFSALKRYTIDASISVVSKIFYINDQESDYSQTTQVVTVQGEFVEYLFSFKDLKLVKNIRFTPAENSFCHFKLVELTSDGLDISASDSNAQKGFDGWDYFYTNNPTYTIYGDFSNATWLRIKGRIRLLDHSEITQEIEKKNQEIEKKNQEIEKKNQEIEKKNQEIELIVNSISWKVTAPIRYSKNKFIKLCNIRYILKKLLLHVNTIIDYLPFGNQLRFRIKSFLFNCFKLKQAQPYAIPHQPLISIISVNYNGTADLVDYFESLLTQTYKSFELIVVDNKSQDDSLIIIDKYSKKFDRFILLKANTNLGFAEANNFAYEHCSGELIALLNIDTRVTENWLFEKYVAMRKDGSIAAVAPKVLFWSKFIDIIIVADTSFAIDLEILTDSLQYKKYFIRKGKVYDNIIKSKAKEMIISLPISEVIRLSFIYEGNAIKINIRKGMNPKSNVKAKSLKAGGKNIIDIKTDTESEGNFIINNAGSGSRSSMPFDIGFGEYDFNQYDAEKYISFFCGVSVLIRRAALIGRNVFVPEMFAYYEDSELSRWFTSHNYKIKYVPKSVVYHKHSATTIEFSPKWKFLVERSRAIFSFNDAKRLRETLNGLMIKYNGQVAHDLYSIIDSNNEKLFKRLEEKDSLYPTEKAIGIYNSFWNTYGGGESHALSVASLCRKYGKVYLISESDFDICSLSNYFNINLDGCIKIVHPRISEKFTEKFDLFINSTYCSNLNSLAKYSWYIVSFPHKNINKKLIKRYFFLHNSDFTAQWANIYWGNHSSKIVYPTGMLKTVDSKRYEKEKIIMSVGRFFVGGHSKKQLDIARAFKDLISIDKSLDDWKLVLIGSYDSSNKKHAAYYNTINSELRGLNHEIIANADRETLISYYERSYIYLHAAGLGENKCDPENHEHFGIAPLEAMSYGCIPLVYEAGGPSELIRRLDVGHSFSDYQDLSSKLKKLCKIYNYNFEENANIAIKANKFIETHNIKEQLSELLIKVYENDKEKMVT